VGILIDPLHRAITVQALEATYFKAEEPPPMMPTGLSSSEGECHELETKRERAKKRKAQSSEVVPVVGGFLSLYTSILAFSTNYMPIYSLGREGYT
jgi:hypothetical protein